MWTLLIVAGIVCVLIAIDEERTVGALFTNGHLWSSRKVLNEETGASIAGLGAVQIFVAMLVIGNVTSEIRSAALVVTLLAVPRRGLVALGKILSSIVIGTILFMYAAVAYCVASMFVALSYGTAAGQALLLQSGPVLWRVAVVVVVVSVVICGLALLCADEVIAVICALLYLEVLPNLTNSLFPNIARWLPWGASVSLIQPVFTVDLSATPLGLLTAVLVLSSFALACALGGLARLCWLDPK